MDTIQPKPKVVNLGKLQSMTDAELEERIKRSPDKVSAKRERYQRQHSLNMARLAAYENYRRLDFEAAKKILVERKSKAGLPLGNQASGKVA